MTTEYRVPESIAEYLTTREPLGSEQIGAFKEWARSLPEVELKDPEDHEHCCCCCCCCSKGHQDAEPTGPFIFNPSLMLRVSPTGLWRTIERITGSFSWNAPAGTTRVTIQWARHGPNGSVISNFVPLGPSYTGLPPTGFITWDTGWGSWGFRVHLRAMDENDASVVSRVRWRDGNGGAGWL